MNFEINALDYRISGQEVQEYPLQAHVKRNKLPYIAASVYMTDIYKAEVYPLVDTGCSVCLISEDFFKTFPSEMQSEKEELNLKLGVATANTFSRISGKISLLLAIKSGPTDQYPLFFKHDFFIASDLQKKMYIGGPLLTNESAVLQLTPDEITFIYPDNYAFPIDPSNLGGYKTVPFYFFTAKEAMAQSAQPFEMKPFQTVVVPCSLSKSMEGQEVFIRNCPEYDNFSTNPICPNNMPRVFETSCIVDNDNRITLTLLNMDDTSLKIPQNALLAHISVSNPNTQKPENFTCDFPEINEVDLFQNFYTADVINSKNREFSENILKPEINWMQFLEDHPITEKLVPTINYIKSEVKQKSDLTQDEFLSLFQLDSLEENIASEIKNIAIQYRVAFSHFPMDIRECNNYTHDIELIGHPTLPKQRPIPDKFREKVAEIIEGYIEVNVMSRGDARLHYSNFVPVGKKDGSVRLCTDLIALNLHIKSVNKVVTMGSPKLLLHRIFHFKYCWAGDLMSAYFHIKVSENCRQYYGTYSYKTFQDYIGFERLIQGEKTSIYSFNNMTNQNFGDMHKNTAIWVDDVVWMENNLFPLIEVFRTFVKRCAETGLSISPTKISFHKVLLRFLGKDIDKEKGCVQIPKAKLQGLKALKPPTDYSSLRSFMGVLKYYNNHIPGVGIAAHPLQELLRSKGKSFKLTPQAHQAFLNVKAAIAESVTLHFPYQNGIYEVWCDASKYCYSAMLYSKPRPPLVGEPHLIACRSGSFKQQMLQHSIYHKELYAVVYAISTWIEYLYGEEIEVFTDCKSLLYAAAAKSDHVLTYRLAMGLSGLNIKFFHVTGLSNKADYSSRQWQTYLDQGVGKEFLNKRKTVDEISNEVEKMTVKPSYSTEEVKMLLTYNFRTPIDEKRLQACKDRHQQIIDSVPCKKPEIKAGCCPDCKIEISHISFAAEKMNHSFPKSSSSQKLFTTKCERCHIPLETESFESHNAFSSFSPQSPMEEKDREGKLMLNYFMTAPITNLFHYTANMGYSIVSNIENKETCNQIQEIHSFTNPNDSSRLFSHTQYKTDAQHETEEVKRLFNDSIFTMPYISIDKKVENSELLFDCTSCTVDTIESLSYYIPLEIEVKDSITPENKNTSNILKLSIPSSSIWYLTSR